ncbi:MAG TPA: ROK family protein [Clostridiales bacterium]|nr:ROK family protein [Clostridiales bacterium]
MTKNEISQRLSLSMPTVAGILQEMEEDGILEYYQEKDVATGRPPLKYLLSSKTHVCVAVLIRDDYFKTLICDVHGRSLFSASFSLPYENNGEYWEEVCSLISKSMDSCELELKKSIGVNVILSCQVDPIEHLIIDRQHGEKFSYFNINQMETMLGAPVYLNNFYESAAFELGSTVAPQGNCIYLHISDVIQSVCMAGGRIFRTWENELGTLGHITLVPLGKKCRCGKFGCAQAYCSTDVFKEVFGEDIAGFLEDRSNTPQKQMFWHEYIFLLSILISNQYNIFKMPVYIGGELAKYLSGEDIELLNTMVCNATGSPYCLYLAGDSEELAIYGAIKILLHNFK